MSEFVGQFWGGIPCPPFPCDDPAMLTELGTANRMLMEDGFTFIILE